MSKTASSTYYTVFKFSVISLWRILICTKVSGNVYWEACSSKMEKLDILCYRWHHADVIFRCL